MKQLKIYLIAFLTTSLAFSQKNISIDYHYYYKQDFAPIADEHDSFLIMNDEESLYVIDVLKNQDKLPETYDTEKGNVRVLKEKNNRFFFKNIKENKVINNENIYFKNFTVISDLSIFNWELTKETKTILGYNCQEAKIRYEGRNYIAYFTNEIPVVNGPWKFHGLPGLILEVYSLDDEIDLKITATNIDLNSSKEISNPYENKKKTYTREEFYKLYRKKYDEVTSYQGEEGVTFGMSKGKIEIIIQN